jgi:hypothetical protein
MAIVTILKIIIEKIIELDNLLFNDSSDPTIMSSYKPLIDNMLLILNLMIKELPECLDLEFVEHFFQSIQERVPLLIAHYHQLLHVQFTDTVVANSYRIS